LRPERSARASRAGASRPSSTCGRRIAVSRSVSSTVSAASIASRSVGASGVRRRVEEDVAVQDRSVGCRLHLGDQVEAQVDEAGFLRQREKIALIEVDHRLEAAG
jgi:hypothetical protein